MKKDFLGGLWTKLGHYVALVLLLVVVVVGALFAWHYYSERNRIRNLEKERGELIRLEENVVKRASELQEDLNWADVELGEYGGVLEGALGELEVMTETMLYYKGIAIAGTAEPTEPEVYLKHADLPSVGYSFDDGAYKGQFQCPTGDYFIKPYPVEFNVLLVKDEHGEWGVETDNELLVVKDFIGKEKIPRRSFWSNFSGSAEFGYTSGVRLEDIDEYAEGGLAVKLGLGFKIARIEYSHGLTGDAPSTFYAGVGF